MAQIPLRDLNLSVSYISFIENAKKSQLTVAGIIAEVMGTTLDGLLSGNQGYGNGEYQNEILLLRLSDAFCLKNYFAALITFISTF